MNKVKLIGVAVAVGLARAAGGDVVFVPDDYPTLNAAVTAANGDTSHWTIWVRPGTWLQSVDIVEPLLLISTDGPQATVISGSFSINPPTPSVTVLGFTLPPVQVLAGSTTIEDCVFDGVRLTIGTGTVVTGCSFTGVMSGNIGGAIEMTGSATVRDSTFVGNSGTDDAGAIYARGLSEITGCTFVGNTAGSRGGAIFWTVATPNDVGRITNCRFEGNSAAVFGGAIYVDQGSPVITGCVMVGNTATFGGAIFNAAGFKTPTIINTTIAGNVAGVGGAIVNDDFVVLEILNSIIWFNGVDPILGTPLSILDVRFSNVPVPYGPGNISVDPLFVDLANGDVHLEAGSSSIDGRGRNWLVPLDTIDLDGDADTTELLPLDLDGNPRFADAPAINDGCGTLAIVDMGAYEFPGIALDCLRPGDVNQDGAVNVIDLIELLLAFGSSCVPTEFECCPADFDLNGGVDVIDLVTLLLAFGQGCP